jgi:hypothetical protein
VAAELAKQEIWVHLDNHVSKAQWCCGADDGNAWFGGGYMRSDIGISATDIFADTYFDPAKWVRGLGYMAEHVSNGELLTVAI